VHRISSDAPDGSDATAAAGIAAARDKTVVLRDRSAVLIRPVRSADAPLLADGFARLSDASRQMRFLTRKKRLSPAELRYFTDVDHRDHEALGAARAAMLDRLERQVDPGRSLTPEKKSIPRTIRSPQAERRTQRRPRRKRATAE
jgi:hypothetical protein